MRVPKYRKHSSGKAFVEWQFRRHYLDGLYGSAESRNEYRTFLREHVFAATEAEEPKDESSTTIVDVVLAYIDFAEAYYPAGNRTEVANLHYAIDPLVVRYGHDVALEFGPRKLKEHRQWLIDTPYRRVNGSGKVIKEETRSRAYINAQIDRIRRMFTWAASEELIPPSVPQALATVANLRKGRTKAREPAKRRPVAWPDVAAVAAVVSPIVSAMISLQWYTGARSDNVCHLRPCEVDQSSTVWLWMPGHHKGTWRNAELIIPIGPRAQAAIGRLIDRDEDTFVFSPRESAGWYAACRAARRKSKRTPSEKARRRPNRRLSVKYTTNTYGQAVSYGIAKAGVPHWTPHQMRHSRATAVRKTHGVEAAKAMLGHESLDATLIYAERDLALAKRVAREVG
ncbi:MAG: tyrosine-type recombinase/integrase [bacterium]|nr:tyrosine-type recombinase/integrase [bacterium]